MANRLNVLVGAELASDVTKKINAEIEKLKLDSIEVKLEVNDKSAKDAAKKIKADFSDALSEITKNMLEESMKSVDTSKHALTSGGKLKSGIKESLETIVTDAIGDASGVVGELKNQVVNIVDNATKTAKKLANTQKEVVQTTSQVNDNLNEQFEIVAKTENKTKKVADGFGEVSKEVKKATREAENLNDALTENSFEDINVELEKQLQLLDERQKKLDELRSSRIQLSGEIYSKYENPTDDDFFNDPDYNRLLRIEDEEDLAEYAVEQSQEIIDSLRERQKAEKETANIVKKAEKDKQEAIEKTKKITKDLKSVLSEIDTYERQQSDLITKYFANHFQQWQNKPKADNGNIRAQKLYSELLEEEFLVISDYNKNNEKLKSLYKERDELSEKSSKTYVDSEQKKRIAMQETFDKEEWLQRKKYVSNRKINIAKDLIDINNKIQNVDSEYSKKAITDKINDILFDAEKSNTSLPIKVEKNGQILFSDGYDNSQLNNYEKFYRKQFKEKKQAVLAEYEKQKKDLEEELAALNEETKSNLYKYDADDLEKLFNVEKDNVDIQKESAKSQIDAKKEESKLAEQTLDIEQQRQEIVKKTADIQVDAAEHQINAIDVQKEAQRISEQLTDDAGRQANKENISVLENEVKQREKIAKQEEKIVEDVAEDVEDSEERKQKAIKNSTKEYENAVKSYQQVYDDAGDLAKESVKYDFKDGHTAKVETFYNLDEDGNVTPSKRVTLDNKEEELAYKERLKLQEEYSKREGEIIAAQIDEQRRFYKEKENYKKTQAKKEEADLIAEGKRILESNKNKSIATENLEEKRQKVLLKTVTVANEVEKSLSKIYDSSSVYDSSIYGYDQDRQLQSFEAELDDINKILSKDKVQLYEIIEAANRLENLKIDSDKFGLDLSDSHDDYVKQIESRKKEEKKAADDYVRFWEKAAVDLREKERKADETAQKAEEKAQDKLYSQKLRLSSNIEEQKRQELIKTQNAYEKLNKTVDDLYKYSGNDKVFGQEQVKEVDRYKAGLKEVEAVLKKENVQYSELIYAQKKLTSLQNSASSFTAELNKQVVAQDKLTQSTKKQIQALSAQHEIKATRLTSQYGDLFDEEEFNLIANHYLVAIERELKKIRPEANRIDETIQEWKRHVGQFETELRASHKQAKRIKDEIEILDSSLGRFIQFYGFGELFRATKTGITEMVSAVSTLDASLVELKKVSDETDATYDKFMDNAADRAKELGVAMSDYIDSVTNFARSGFDFSEAQEIAKTVNIMQMVSEQMSADEASEYLISIIRGFNIEASKSIDIVNALNNVDRRSQSEMPGQTLSFYRRTSRNGRPIPRTRLFYVMCA